MNLEAHMDKLVANEKAFIEMHDKLADLEDGAEAEKDRREAAKHRARLALLMVSAHEFEMEVCHEAR